MGKALQDMTLEELWQLFPIELSCYNPDWADWADDEMKALSILLKRFSPVLNHIGSTAIPEIMAKPIVDILVEVPENAAYGDIKDVFESNGYICMAEDEDRLSFNKGYTPDGYADKVFHIHVRRSGDNSEIIFRDYLRNHPKVREEYEMLKMSLLPEYKNDRDGYTAAKTNFVRRVLSLAGKESNDGNGCQAIIPRKVEIKETELVDESYFPEDYELHSTCINDEGKITLLRCEGLEFIKSGDSLAILSRVDSSVGSCLEIPQCVYCGDKEYEVYEVSLAQPNHTVKSIYFPDSVWHFENACNFQVLEKIGVSSGNDCLIAVDDVLYWKFNDGTLHIEAIPVQYQKDKILLSEYVVDFEYDVADWLACAPAPKDVVYENPAKYLSIGKPGKLMDGEVVCGIFHFKENYFISRIDKTDDSFIVVPNQIITAEESDFVSRIDIGEDNPVSPNVKTLYVPCQAKEYGIDFYGNFSVAFPNLENILLCDDELLSVPAGNIEEALQGVGDEELVVFKDSVEYRESLMDPEWLEELKADGGSIVLLNEQYWIKSKYIEFLYNPDTETQSVEKIYNTTAKSIVIPPFVNAMGRRLRVTSVCLDDADENHFEVLWVPVGCSLEGTCGNNLKAIRFYCH